jgi:hypothetical protein
MNFYCRIIFFQIYKSLTYYICKHLVASVCQINKQKSKSMKSDRMGIARIKLLILQSLIPPDLKIDFKNKLDEEISRSSS